MAISVTKPTVGGSENTWGATINTGIDTIVGALNGTSGTVAPDLSTLTINGTDVTATAAELNTLDGVTATTAELNTLDGVTATAAALNTASTHYVPSGGIIIWSGAANAVPTGWALCNGGNGTPNLQDRFVVGAGSAYAVGATGGAATVTLSAAQMPSHQHTGTTSSAGNHSHSVNNAYGVTPSTVYDGYFDGSRIAGEGQERNLVTTQTTNTTGAHSHSFTTTSAGSNAAHENRPPYYALAYIMKT